MGCSSDVLYQYLIGINYQLIIINVFKPNNVIVVVVVVLIVTEVVESFKLMLDIYKDFVLCRHFFLKEDPNILLSYKFRTI